VRFYYDMARKRERSHATFTGGRTSRVKFCCKAEFSSARLQRVRPIERSQAFSAESASFPKFEHKRISRTGSESTRTPRGRQLCPENARTQDDRSEMPTASPKCGLSLVPSDARGREGVEVCLGSSERNVNDCAIGSRRYALFLRLSVVSP
jgi:hypothetical protein